MAVLLDTNTRLIVQGLTGREGTFHAKAAQAYHTAVVGGVSILGGTGTGTGPMPGIDPRMPVRVITGGSSAIPNGATASRRWRDSSPS